MELWGTCDSCEGQICVDSENADYVGNGIQYSGGWWREENIIDSAMGDHWEAICTSILTTPDGTKLFMKLQDERQTVQKIFQEGDTWCSEGWFAGLVDDKNNTLWEVV